MYASLKIASALAPSNHSTSGNPSASEASIKAPSYFFPRKNDSHSAASSLSFPMGTIWSNILSIHLSFHAWSIKLDKDFAIGIITTLPFWPFRYVKSTELLFPPRMDNNSQKTAFSKHIGALLSDWNILKVLGCFFSSSHTCSSSQSESDGCCDSMTLSSSLN